ncbi:hypothetical protein BGZ99_006191 [Dissophora globulifera]|uniref:Uncharacterized protein n=1 Tax=Dissophora globulifera TaxID=979702 RepID=A0A9P6URI0_9FUNG|nr:hypothetical protein BGZ99_006191 [Dissophora globulifera]
MHIDPASIEQDWYNTLSPQEQQRQQSLRGPRVPSRSNSLSKRVTFDEHIMVLGNISGLPLSLSPIPESFSYEDHQRAMMIDAQMIAQKLQQQEFDSNLRTMPPQPRSPSLVQSPASSPSSSCRSSICSVSSLSSVSSVSSVSSSSSRGSDSGAKKSRSASSRLASIFHTSPHRCNKDQQSIPRAMSDGEYQPGIHRRKSLIQRLGLKKNKTL